MIYVLMRVGMMVCTAISTTLVADDCKGPEAGGGGGSTKICDTVLERPRVALRPQGLTIVTYSVSSCDVAPQRHVVHLSLEHQVGSENGSERGDWKPMPSYDGTTFRSCEAIPHPGSNVRCEWYIPCIAAGWYQTRSTVTGTGPQGAPFSFTVPEAPDAKIACHP
jgi:hypothetical protein